MSRGMKKRIVTKSGSLVILFLLAVTGCSTVDHWYDIEDLNDGGSVGDIRPVTEDQLPKPQWHEEVPLPVAEDGRISLSLEQAVFFAMQRNPELRVERYGPLIAGTFEQIERGMYDPELFADLSSSKTTAITSTAGEGSQSADEDVVEGVLGLRQDLPLGTSLEISVGYERIKADEDPEEQDVRLGLSVTQSLLRGFGTAVNLAAIRQAQFESQASLYEFRGFVEALLSEVEIAYWRYVLENEGLAILEQSLDIARKQLLEVESRIEVGVIPRNSVAAAKAEVARREQALLEGKSRRIERRLRLLRLLNVRNEHEFQLGVDPTSQPRILAEPLPDLDARLMLALKNRPDLNEAKLRERQQNLEVVRTRSGLLPRLDLFIDLGKSGYAGSFAKTWSNLDDDGYDLLAGAQFSSYLGNRAAEAKHLAARASRDQARAAIANLENVVQLDVRLAANEVERTRQQIEASRVTREMEEETLKAEQERFSVGDTTSLLVAQAQRDLLVSRLAEVEAVVAYRIAMVNLYLAEGSLLERRGITLDNPAG